MASETLPPREERILLEVLREFAESHRPVGSRLLALQEAEGLSPATVRTVLHRLEERGFLSKSHASSGRLPTDRAVRYLIDRAIRDAAPPGSETDLEAPAGEDADLDVVARATVGNLSLDVRSLGFVTTPPLREARLRACELLALAPGKVLLVVVSLGGHVHEQWLIPPRPYAAETLRSFGNYLTEAYEGWTFAEIREHLRCQVERGTEAAGQLQGRAEELVAPYFLAEAADTGLFWDGARWLLADAGLRADLEALRSLVGTLEERGRLLRFLDEIWDQVTETTVAVGEEWPDPAARGLALVAASYGDDVTGRGFVGVIGPRWMQFERAVPRVRAAAQVLARASRGFARGRSGGG